MHPSPPIPSVFSSNIILIILLSNKQLINVKKHSPILQALLYVIHSTHFLTIHILINKMDQFKSNKTNHKPHFILHNIYYVSAPRCHLHSVHQKQIVLQAVEAFIFIIRIKSPIMLKIQITNVN